MIRGAWYAVGLLALQHFLVDGVCACSLYLLLRSGGLGDLLWVFILYNVLAFLTQPLTGWLADRIAHKHWQLLASMLLLTIGVAALLIPPLLGRGVGGEAIFLGLGNSLFHTWGGKQVAVTTGNDMRALGIFVSTGALGLAVGMLYASVPLLLVMLLAYCLVSSRYVVVSRCEVPRKETTSYLVPRKETTPLLWGVWVGFLLLFVAFRSGVSTVFTQALGTGTWAVLMAATVAMLGKAFGGFLCQWTGWLKGLLLMLVFTLIPPLLGRGVGGEAILLGRGVGGEAILLVRGVGGEALSLFSISCTMPVTLWLSNRLLPGREGLSFGLLAAALMPGYLLAQSSPPWEGVGEASLSLLSPLISTILFELLVLWLLRERRSKVLWGSVLMNVLTNVPLNVVVLFGPHPTPVLHIVLGELAVVAVETVCYFLLLRRWRQALVYSLLTNSVSFLLGLLLQMVWVYLQLRFAF